MLAPLVEGWLITPKPWFSVMLMPPNTFPSLESLVEEGNRLHSETPTGGVHSIGWVHGHQLPLTLVSS